MKRLIFTLSIILSTLGAKAMSYERAREEAIYLTDKMAYELNLNDAQYEYAYEINLDYLMGLRTADDIYGNYYVYRNADLRAILYDWQWKLFAAADYFFRPVCWRHGTWYFPIYTYYARNYYYYTRPHFYYSYRGTHCRDHYHAGFYHNRRPEWRGGFRGEDRAHHNEGRPGLRPDMSARRGRNGEQTRRGGRVEGDGFSFSVPSRNNHQEQNRGLNRDNNRQEQNRGLNRDNNRQEQNRSLNRGNNTTRNNSYRGSNNQVRENRERSTSSPRNYDRSMSRSSSNFSGSSSRGANISRSSQHGGGNRNGGMSNPSRGNTSNRGGSRGGR